MKKRLACILVCVPLLSGCVMVSGQSGDIKVTSWRMLWKSEDIRFNVVSTNVVATLYVGKSATDSESLKAIVDAAVTATMKSLTHVP